MAWSIQALEVTELGGELDVWVRRKQESIFKATVRFLA